MENTNMNANVNALGRPVMLKDIAEKLGLAKNTVAEYLRPNWPWPNGKTCQLVRKTAKEMGYDSQKVLAWTGAQSAGRKKDVKGPNMRDIAEACGVSVSYVSLILNGHKNCNTDLAKKVIAYVSSIGYKTMAEKKQEKTEAEQNAQRYWFNTAFKTRADFVSYCKYLREEGYGNTEIAKRAGVTRQTVRRNIGAEPIALAKHNRVVGQKLRAQKNAARRSYLRNQPIAEYNAKVDEHNALKAKVAAMEAELAAQTPAIEQAAAKKVYVPNLNLAQLSPTALQ